MWPSWSGARAIEIDCVLGDELRAEAQLRERVAAAHDRVGWAAAGAGCFERRGRADGEAEPAESEAEVLGVSHFDFGQRGRDLACRGLYLEVEVDGRGHAESIRA